MTERERCSFYLNPFWRPETKDEFRVKRKIMREKN